MKDESDTGISKAILEYNTKAMSCAVEYLSGMASNALKMPENTISFWVCMYDAGTRAWGAYCDAWTSYLKSLEDNKRD